MAVARMLAAAVALGGVAYGVWRGLDALLGTRLLAQIVSVGVAIAAGLGVYAVAVLALRIREAHQVRALIAGPFRRANRG